MAHSEELSLALNSIGFKVFLTCSSPSSRNYTVGFRLGQGQKLEEIIENLGSVAEGVSTSQGLHEIVQEMGVSAPVRVRTQPYC